MRSHILLIFIVVLVGLASCSPPSEIEEWLAVGTVIEYDPNGDAWIKDSSLPTYRGYCVVTDCNGKIYAIGGHSSTSDGHLYSVRGVEAYESVTGTWDRKAEIPIENCYRPIFYAFSVNGKIYVIRNPSTTMYEYDPTLDIWTQRAVPPAAGRCIPFGTNIYVFDKATIQKYDSGSDTWSPCADVPVNYYAVAAVSGRIFAVAGRDTENGSPSQMWEYDPGGDQWSRKTDMPLPQIVHATHVIGDRLYAIGARWDMPSTELLEEYDSTTDTWTRKMDSPVQTSFNSFTMNGKIYVFTRQGQVHEFDPAGNAWANRTGTTREAASSAVSVAGKFYLVGGIILIR